jgi:hypothetical protein
VPPALPACMTIGVSMAMLRLRRRQIFCIQPTRYSHGDLAVALLTGRGAGST